MISSYQKVDKGFSDYSNGKLSDTLVLAIISSQKVK